MINTYNESHLHHTLKQRYAPPYAQTEVQIGPYVVDVAFEDRIVEIQTAQLYASQNKLRYLLDRYWVKLVFPIMTTTTITLNDADGTRLSRRKSPKKRSRYDIFHEMVRCPDGLLGHERFSLELVMVQVEEIRCADGLGSWRRKGISIKDRRCMHIEGFFTIYDSEDLLSLIAEKLPFVFTTADLQESLGVSRALAQKMAWWMRKNGWVECVGKKERFHLYHTKPEVRQIVPRLPQAREETG